jgi:hypothetical protein
VCGGIVGAVVLLGAVDRVAEVELEVTPQQRSPGRAGGGDLPAEPFGQPEDALD